MPRIYMKEFASIATSSGTKKISKIKHEKNKPPYTPAIDYYKRVREAIIASHMDNLGESHITDEADKCSDPKKKPHHQQIAKKYCEWIVRNNGNWFIPPRGSYQFSSSEIVLNPEIGLETNGDKKVIKLYFPDKKVSQNLANYMIHLMEGTLPQECQYCVLDICRKKLFTSTGNPVTYFISINTEIVGIEAAWESL